MTGEPLQYTHSGRRYLLGYDASAFGIWDRERDGGAPIERFARTDAGWADAWTRYAALEPEAVEVGLVAPRRAAVVAPASAAKAAAPARVHPGWWSLPLLLGWIGGLVAWAGTKHLDRRVARRLLLVGILESVVVALILLGGGTLPGA